MCLVVASSLILFPNISKILFIKSQNTKIKFSSKNFQNFVSKNTEQKNKYYSKKKKGATELQLKKTKKKRSKIQPK